MENIDYLATMHCITRSLSVVEYPTTKQELLDLVGDDTIDLDWGATTTMREILEKLSAERFDTAACLFCGITVVL